MDITYPLLIQEDIAQLQAAEVIAQIGYDTYDTMRSKRYHSSLDRQTPDQAHFTALPQIVAAA